MTSSDNALEQLISQFAQPLAFLRELIQNSLDAGTTIVEVEVGYDSDSDCCFVRVADNGHGMDREVIDNKLTKLFASTKENDLTKIGKFGIGFVSIFAVEPELVVLETGQHGESWRVLFLPDRSFERRELEEPVDGTTVTVFLARKRSELKQLVADCRDTVIFWCKHSDIEIVFNGSPINQPFELPGSPYQYRYKVQGTEAVVAPVEASDGFHGYYNRGLTLLEGDGSPLSHISFKLRSRYLEHTLSRDNIIQDKNYEKAMAVVRKAAFEKMPRDLFSRLEEQDESELWAAAAVVLKLDPSMPKKLRGFKIFPSRETKLSLADLSTSLYEHPRVDDLWIEVERTGETILCLEEGSEFKRQLLNELGYSPEPLRKVFFRYRVVEEPEEQEAELLAELKRSTRQILTTPILVDSLNVPPLWTDRFSAYLNPRETVSKNPLDAKGWPDRVGIRRDHPLWGKLLQLWGAEPTLAVALMVRMVNLELGVARRHEATLFNTLINSVRDRVATE